MDDLTRERHPYPIPYRETKARPLPPGWVRATPEQIAERRIVLCGVDDTATLIHGGGASGARWRIADRVLIDAIRRYSP
jgi:hypothetical protein